MKKILCFLSVLLGFSCQAQVAKPALYERAVQTWEDSQPEIKLLLRVPEGHTPETPTAQGVLAFCTWEMEDASLRKRLLNESDPLVLYAKRNKLAILTWNTATLWKTGKSFNQISRSERLDQERTFTAMTRAWERGVNQLCKEQNLPQRGFLLYGISRGAHWSERLAVHAPGNFLAVFIHVANSYEKVSGNSGGPLWLVSSGDLDVGRDNAVTFYRLCQAKGLPVVLKVANGLGHATSPEIEHLRDVFFDYALEVRQRAVKETPAAVMLGDLRRASLTGDLLTQEVYRGAEANIVPAAQRIPLPDEKLAKAWGFLRK